MNVQTRIKALRLMQIMEKNKEYVEKIGVDCKTVKKKKVKQVAKRA